MMKIPRRRSRFGLLSALCIITAAVLPAAPASAEVFYIDDTGFIVEPPVGWQVMEVTDTRWTFNDFSGEAFLQIKVYPGGEYDSAPSIYEGVCSLINAEGDSDGFELYGRDAVFAVLDFNAGGYDYTGYGIFADGDDFDLAILSFASAEHSELLGDYIASALDSFALSPVYMLKPGPISTYYLESYGGPERVPATTVFEGQALEWAVDAHSIETSQLVIEREARILADFKPDTEEGIEAWKRYYRIIYRDCYSRLDYPAALFRDRLTSTAASEESDSWFSSSGSGSGSGSGSAGSGDSAGTPGSFRLRPEKSSLQDAPSRLLGWVQGFEYMRTGGSDLISPLYAAAFQEGDCDSRSLLYIILLNHYGIDSALMVSAVYSHAMAAADVPGAGARIDAGRGGYLVAETTDDVEMGMIAADMADPAKWVVIPLMEKEPWN